MKKTAWWMWVLRVGLFLVVTVISLAALAVAWISFEGRRELAKTKSELLARGEKLSLAELIPPPIPDEQNFYADPMWLELADLVETSDGVKEPRLPRGSRQLDDLDRNFTKEDETAFKEKFPSIQGEQKSAASAALTLLRNWELLSPEERRKRAEYLRGLLEFDQPILQQIHDLLQRPSAQFPLSFEDRFLNLKVHHLNYVMSLAQRLRARALIDLELGNFDPARKNTQKLFSLSEKMQEPHLINYLVRISFIEMGVSIVDMGLKGGAWNEGDLLRWENDFSQWDELQQLQQALRFERAGFNSLIADIHAGKLSAYYRDLPALKVLKYFMWITLAGDQAMYNQIMQSGIDASGNADGNGFRKELFSESKFQERVMSNPWRYPLTKIVMPSIEGLYARVAVIQTQINQTRIACALDRYRLGHGEYPASLDVLVPDFLPEIPRDVVTALPMRYLRTAPDSFRLWSVGSNEIDEGGVPGDKRDTGDWVWGTPIPRK